MQVTLLLLAGSLVSIVAHETGHLVFGTLVGLSVQSARFGPFLIHCRDKWAIRLQIGLRQFLSGYVSFIPQLGMQRWKWALATVGGPLVSASVAGYGIARLGGRADAMVPAHPFLSALVGCSALVIVGSLLWLDDPWKPNDIFNFVNTLGSESWKRWVAILFADYLSAIGIRPSQWPRGIDQDLWCIHDGSRTELRATLLAVINRVDNKQFLGISGLIERAETLGRHFQMWDIMADLAFWISTVPGYRAKAEELLSHLGDASPHHDVRACARRRLALLSALNECRGETRSDSITELANMPIGAPSGITVAEIEIIGRLTNLNDIVRAALPSSGKTARR